MKLSMKILKEMIVKEMQEVPSHLMRHAVSTERKEVPEDFLERAVDHMDNLSDDERNLKFIANKEEFIDELYKQIPELGGMDQQVASDVYDQALVDLIAKYPNLRAELMPNEEK
tara:strand:+ start:313 stop:654 length:342 start_codon:yes stop_codon:yes gene_type:complete